MKINIFTLTENAINLTLLWCLHGLFFINETVNDVQNELEIVQSQKAFLTIAPTADELNMKLMDPLMDATKPGLLVQGSCANVENVYVYFEQQRYDMTSILGGIDQLLKIYCTLNIAYPKQACQFYEFLQNCFCNIPACESTNNSSSHIAAIIEQLTSSA